MKSFFDLWKGQFDSTNVYQLTRLRHDYPEWFVPLSHPIHSNTGVYIHDVDINKQNELLVDQLLSLPENESRKLFESFYQDPPFAVGRVYRPGKVCASYLG